VVGAVDKRLQPPPALISALLSSCLRMTRAHTIGRTLSPSDADAFIAAREEPSLRAALELPPATGRAVPRTRGLPWVHLAQYPRVWAWACYFQAVFDTAKVRVAICGASL
jgi:hypothetical protein